MPTYEYKCDSCGYQFEKFQSMKDAPIKKCPDCGGPVKRLIGGGVGIIFKGSGFYQTDYKGANPSSGANSPKGDGAAPCGRSDKCPACE